MHKYFQKCIEKKDAYVLCIEKKHVYRLIVFTLLLLFIISVFSGSEKTDWIANSILALTALIVLWYTKETAEMKEEVVKQNSLMTRPVLSIETRQNKVFLVNEGQGSATNVVIEKINEMFEEREFTEKDKYEYFIGSTNFITANKPQELFYLKTDIKTGYSDTICDLSSFFMPGWNIDITLAYNDIEGTKYKTHFKKKAGSPNLISFEKIAG